MHARYQREEILAALDFPRTPNSFREGVFYFAEWNIDAFFITLNKSEADYSPTTMYARLPDLARPCSTGSPNRRPPRPPRPVGATSTAPPHRPALRPS